MEKQLCREGQQQGGWTWHPDKTDVRIRGRDQVRHVPLRSERSGKIAQTAQRKRETARRTWKRYPGKTCAHIIGKTISK
eukprot:scaffold94236_cov23-Tisochrysis_lutea.AAC.1